MRRGRRARSEAQHLAGKQSARQEERTARLQAAMRSWARLSRPNKLVLVREIVETRGAELRRACAGVMSVGYGHVTRRVRGRRRLLAEPCVKFGVEEKWEDRPAEAREGTVPRYLYAYFPTRGRRVMCAVPTDVESFGGVKAQWEDTGVRVAGQEDGGVAAVVEIPGEPGRYVLSCRHVFGLTRTVGTAPPPESEVTRPDDGTTIARTAAIYGPLVPHQRISFDAALARLDDDLPPALSARVPALAFTDWVRDGDEIEGRKYEIWTPQGAKRARWSATLPKAPGLSYAGIEGLVHMDVVMFASEIVATPGQPAMTEPGDSGSPVVTLDGRQLIGMHVAGKDSTAFMIPAFELMRTANYVGLARGKLLKLVSGG